MNVERRGWHGIGDKILTVDPVAYSSFTWPTPKRPNLSSGDGCYLERALVRLSGQPEIVAATENVGLDTSVSLRRENDEGHFSSLNFFQMVDICHEADMPCPRHRRTSAA